MCEKLMKKGYLKKYNKNGLVSIWKKKKSPRNSRMQEVTTGMREIGINNMEWIDRGQCRRKIKLQEQKDVKTLIIFP